jgi:uncharacterized protein YuzE
MVIEGSAEAKGEIVGVEITGAATLVFLTQTREAG